MLTHVASPPAVQHLRTLLTLVLTNSEARKLLGDFSLIGRDLFATGAAKAAEAARPDPERMARVDDPAPHGQFVTEGGRTIDAQSGETPVLEASIPHPTQEGNVTIKQHPKADVGTGATIEHPDGTTMSGAEAKERAAQQGGQALDEGRERAMREQEQVQGEVQQTDDPDEQKEIAKGSLKSRIAGYKVRFYFRACMRVYADDCMRVVGQPDGQGPAGAQGQGERACRPHEAVLLRGVLPA